MNKIPSMNTISSMNKIPFVPKKMMTLRPARASRLLAGAALFATIGILAGLHKRSRDAQGTHVDIGMLDCQAALLETALARFDVEGKVPQRTGDAHPSLAPFETFLAEDGRASGRRDA